MRNKYFNRLAILTTGCLMTTSAWTPARAEPERAKMVAHLSRLNTVDAALAQVHLGQTNLPGAVRSAVIDAAVNRTDISAEAFEVVEAEPQDWPDGCLGLAESGTACTQAIVPGWQVVIQANQQQWTFRTDNTGSEVRLASSRNLNGTNSSYGDIEGHWAQSCIQRLSQQGTISGYPDNTFRPDSPITRAEYAALLNQAFPDVEAQRGTANFVDVSSDYWGQEAIQTAYRKGFLSGYPNQEFRPNDLISRVETFVALASGLDYDTPDNVSGILATAYGDAAEIPAYATEEIAALTQQQAIVKTDAGSNRFNPATAATRAQVAATLCQLKFEVSGIPNDYIAQPVQDPDQSVILGQTCTNQVAGYTVDYPTDWKTNNGGVLNACQVFDPVSISLPERSSSFDEAIHLRFDSIPFEEVTDEDDITATILSRRTTTVDGYEAVVEESESTGRALLQAGVRSYSYIINLGDGEIMVASTYDVATQEYSRNKQVLDQMVNSLRFSR
jgi:hypothetical protein